MQNICYILEFENRFIDLATTVPAMMDDTPPVMTSSPLQIPYPRGSEGKHWHSFGTMELTPPMAGDCMDGRSHPTPSFERLLNRP